MINQSISIGPPIELEKKNTYKGENNNNKKRGSFVEMLIDHEILMAEQSNNLGDWQYNKIALLTYRTSTIAQTMNSLKPIVSTKEMESCTARKISDR